MDILYINCKHKKKDYYNTFVSLKKLENKETINEIAWLNKHSVMYRTKFNSLDTFEFVNLNAVKKDKNFSKVSNNYFDIKKTKIVLNLSNDYDETIDDIYNYKYFILLQKNCFEANNRFIYFDYSESEIFKIASYINFNYIDTNNIFGFNQKMTKSVSILPKKFSISEEWLPAIYIDEEILEILRNNYNISEILNTTNIITDDQKKVDFEKLYNHHKKENRRLLYLKVCINLWIKKYKNIEKIVKDKIIEDKLNSLPLFALLLFLLQCLKYGFKDYNIDEIYKLIDISCDYSEGMLQLAENTLNHSNGGVLSVRLNNNKYKLNIKTDIKCWYLRMSVCDFSTSSIVDNIKKKIGKKHKLALCNVFFEENNDAYTNYLNLENNVIHHYGLMKFSQIVQKNFGTFTLFSAKSSQKNDSTYYYAKHDSITEKDLSNNQLEVNHIPGTDYDILLPLLPLETEKNYSPSLPVNQILNRRKLDTSKCLYVLDYFDIFKSGENNAFSLDIFQNKFSKSKYNEQEKKEKIIDNAVRAIYNNLLNKIKNENLIEYEDFIIYFGLESCKYKRIEAIAKIIMGLVIKFNNQSFNIHFILQDLNENNIVFFVRQFALFYRNNINNYMSKSQIYIQSDDGLKDVLFFSNYLSAIYDHNLLMQLGHGINSEIIDRLYHISFSYFKKNENDKKIPMNTAIDFESLPKCYYDKNNKPTTKNGNPLLYKKLIKIVSTDIHNENLGCKICNTHIKANKVHLSDFFEAQILFGNAYWCSHFVDYIVNELVFDESINKNLPLILYGYENYSEPMLYLVRDNLNSKGYICDYIIFENSKYITPNHKSDLKIRYIENLKSLDKSQLQIISLIGISTTLSTLETMQLELTHQNTDISKEKFIKNLIIFQLINKLPIKNNVIKFDTENKTVELKNNENQQSLMPLLAKYYVEIEANWMEPENCSLCFPEKSYLEEQFLINTNETSTVPMLLIKPKDKIDYSQKKLINNKEEIFTDSFLNNIENKQFLYYLHINRGGNHYQYYIRTAALLTSELNNYNIDENIGLWFNNIKKILNTDMNKKINILVCPAHFSNETFVTAVNKYVFNGNAYLINFDVRKEFRDTFEAKYSNYLSVLKLIINKNTNTNYDVNICFHYVDDQIVTGDTYFRAKSLVSGLMRKIESKKVPIIFESIITLIDRNSNSSRTNYFDTNQKVKFYSYLRFYTPSIRSYGDSCPLCKKVSNSKKLSHEASLTFTSEYWNNKSKQHTLIPLTNAKKYKIYYNPIKSDREFMRLQSSEYIWKNINCINSKEYLADSIIYEFINKNNISDNNKLEYIISFYKICSREHIIFQENINNYIFKILLETFSLFTDSPTQQKNSIKLYEYLYRIIHKKDKELKGIIYDLYCIIITRLCALGSNWLLNRDRLIDCYEIGEKYFSTDSYNQVGLSIISKDHYDSEIIPEFTKLSFAEFLSIQIKKSLFVTDDSIIKSRKYNAILEKELKNYE